MTAPASSTVPVSALSWPQMQLNSVVLPAPLGPTRPTVSPISTVKVMWLTAAIPPNDLDTSPAARSGASEPPPPPARAARPSACRPLLLVIFGPGLGCGQVGQPVGAGAAGAIAARGHVRPGR